VSEKVEIAVLWRMIRKSVQRFSEKIMRETIELKRDGESS